MTERNPTNPRVAAVKTQLPTPNEIKSSITTTNQCAIEVDELWKEVKLMKKQIQELEKEVSTLKNNNEPVTPKTTTRKASTRGKKVESTTNEATQLKNGENNE